MGRSIGNVMKRGRLEDRVLEVIKGVWVIWEALSNMKNAG